MDILVDFFDMFGILNHVHVAWLHPVQDIVFAGPLHLHLFTLLMHLYIVHYNTAYLSMNECGPYLGGFSIKSLTKVLDSKIGFAFIMPVTALLQDLELGDLLSNFWDTCLYISGNIL